MTAAWRIADGSDATATVHIARHGVGSDDTTDEAPLPRGGAGRASRSGPRVTSSRKERRWDRRQHATRQTGTPSS